MNTEIGPYLPDRCDPHAIVREEDTQLVLAADPEPRPVRENLRALEAAAMRAEPRSPGGVVVRPGRPLILLAVIHDLDLEPTWREEWIVDSNERAMREAARRGLTRIAMPLLGTVHGRLPHADAAELLIEGMRRAGTARPATLWLEGVDEETLALVRHRLQRQNPEW